MIEPFWGWAGTESPRGHVSNDEELVLSPPPPFDRNDVLLWPVAGAQGCLGPPPGHEKWDKIFMPQEWSCPTRRFWTSWWTRLLGSGAADEEALFDAKKSCST